MATIPTPGSVVRHVRKTVTFDGGAGSGAVGEVVLWAPTGAVTAEKVVIRCTSSFSGAAELTVGFPDFGYGDTYGYVANASTISAGDYIDGSGNGSQPGGGAVRGTILAFSADAPLKASIANANITAGTIVIDLWYTPITDDGALAGDDIDVDYDDYIEARVAAALATYDPPTKAELDSGLAGLNDLDAAGIRSAVGLSSANLDTQLSTIDSEIGTIDGIVDAILVDTAEIGTAGAGLTEAGGTGDQFTAIPWNASWDAEVQSEATDALNAYDPPTKAELDSGLSGLSFPSASSIADAVLDEALSGHTTAGSLGKAVADIESDATAILADTAEIGAAGAGLTEAGGTGDHLSAVPWNAAWDAEVQSEVADALAVYDPPTKAELDSGLAGLENLSAAQVASEIADALSSDTLTEAYAASGAEATVAQLLYAIYSTVAQFSISGTTLTTKKLDGTTTALTFTLDDDTNPTSRVRSA